MPEGSFLKNLGRRLAEFMPRDPSHHTPHVEDPQTDLHPEATVTAGRPSEADLARGREMQEQVVKEHLKEGIAENNIQSSVDQINAEIALSEQMYEVGKKIGDRLDDLGYRIALPQERATETLNEIHRILSSRFSQSESPDALELAMGYISPEDLKVLMSKGIDNPQEIAAGIIARVERDLGSSDSPDQIAAK